MDENVDETELGPDLRQPEVQASLRVYWATNVRWTLCLLTIWAMAGLGCGILFADRLNETMLFGTGYPLGFWFAQQGSIIIFVFLILTYCLVMNRLDAKHHRDLKRLASDAKDRVAR